MGGGPASVRPRTSSLLAETLLAEVDDLLGVLLRHERRAGQDLGGGGHAVLRVVGQEDDRQVTLEKLLLVDGEGHVPVADGLEDGGREVEGGERDLLQLARLPQGLERGLRAGRAERQHPVDVGVLLYCRVDLGLRVGGVVEVNGHHLDLAAEALLEALAALIERDVSDLLVDAERVVHTLLREPLAGALPGYELGLPDVGERPEVLADVAAGVYGDDRYAGVVRLLDRLAQRLGVGDGDDQPVRLGGDGGVDELAHLHRVECLGRVVLDLDAHISGALVHPVLDHGPERVGGLAVGDDRDPDVSALRATPALRLAAFLATPAARGDERHHRHQGEPDPVHYPTSHHFLLSAGPTRAPVYADWITFERYSRLLRTSSIGPEPVS